MKNRDIAKRLLLQKEIVPTSYNEKFKLMSFKKHGFAQIKKVSFDEKTISAFIPTAKLFKKYSD